MAANQSKAAIEKDALQFNMAKLDPLLPGRRNSYNPRAYWNI
jgi:hypothetical protein